MITSAIQLLVLMGFLVPYEKVISYVERKLEADMQARVGPSLTGKSGVLQTVADWFKLIQKAPSPTLNDSETVWFIVQVVILFSSLALVPVGPGFPLVDSQLAVFLPILALFFHGIAGVFLGVQEGSLQKTLSSMRRAAQMIATILPVILILITEGIYSKGFSWEATLHGKHSSVFGLALISNPAQWLAFLVFLLSGLAYLSINPMNSDCSKTDIAGGTQAFFTGPNRVIFDFSSFYLKFIWAAITMAVFLKGYHLPAKVVELLGLSEGSTLVNVLEWFYSFIKISLLIITSSVLSRVNPRYRADQVTDFAWKVLSPMALLCLLGAIIWTAGMDH